MSDADRDLAALFVEERAPPRDTAFIARVAGEVARVQRRRLWLMSVGGLALGLGVGLVLALAAPLLGEAGRLLGEAMRLPGVSWAVVAAGLALGLAVPLWRAR